MDRICKILVLLIFISINCLSQPPFYGSRMFISLNLQDTVIISGGSISGLDSIEVNEIWYTSLSGGGAGSDSVFNNIYVNDTVFLDNDSSVYSFYDISSGSYEITNSVNNGRIDLDAEYLMYFNIDGSNKLRLSSSLNTSYQSFQFQGNTFHQNGIYAYFQNSSAITKGNIKAGTTNLEISGSANGNINVKDTVDFDYDVNIDSSLAVGKTVEALKVDADSIVSGYMEALRTKTDTLEIGGQTYVSLSVFKDIKQYGAVGDSVTDDSQALIDAMADADTNSTIYFPEGYYFFNRRIEINKPITFQGSGGRVKVTMDSVLFDIKANDVKISGIAFYGDEDSTDQGIIFDSAYYRLKVDGCDFFNVGGTVAEIKGIVVTEVNQGVSFDNCSFVNNDRAIFFDERGEYSKVKGCIFESNTTAVQNNAGNNTFEASFFIKNYDAIIIENGTNDGHGSITNCYLNHNTNFALYINNQETGFEINGGYIYEGDVYVWNSDYMMFSGVQIGSDILNINNIEYSSFADCQFVQDYGLSITITNSGIESDLFNDCIFENSTYDGLYNVLTELKYPYMGVDTTFINTAQNVEVFQGGMKKVFGSTLTWDGHGYYPNYIDTNTTAQFEFLNSVGNMVFGFVTDANPRATDATGYDNYTHSIYLSGTNVYKIENTSISGSLTTVSANDLLRLKTLGDTVYYQKSTDDGDTWSTYNTSTTLFTYPSYLKTTIRSLDSINNVSVVHGYDIVWDSIEYVTPLPLDLSNHDHKYIKITGNITINISNIPEGESYLWVQQDGSGSHTIIKGTGWGTVDDGAATLSTTADAINVIKFQKYGDIIIHDISTVGN